MIHPLVSIEYSPTSEEGVAIIYHVEGWENKEAAFSDVNIWLNEYITGRNNININNFILIRYSTSRPGGQNDTTCSYLGNITDRSC